jgi:hypothetical protein
MKINKTSVQPKASSDKLPFCKRDLQFSTDGAKYYNPIPLKTNDKIYTVDEMRDISLDFINGYEKKMNYTNDKLTNIKVPFDQDYIDKNKGIPNNLGIFTAWLDVLHNHLLDKITNDLNLDKNKLKSNIYLFYRSPKGQENASGIFHEDGTYDKNPYAVQMIYPLDKTEMGTLFVPDKYKEHFTNTHTGNSKQKNTKAYVYDSKDKIGIVEQADPAKIFAMLRHKHPKGVIHAVPKEITHTNKPIRRPLLTFEFY